jgi:hypothetical protein
MKTLFLLVLLLAITSCENNIKDENHGSLNEIHLKTFEKMSPDSIVCANTTCITEEELYQKRGKFLFSLEDKLFYLKHKLAKDLLIQKIVEEKLLKEGQSFADYDSNLRKTISVSEQEIRKVLKELQVSEIRKDGPAWKELEGSLIGQKVNAHYSKLLVELSGAKDFMVKIPKRFKPTLDLPSNILIPLHSLPGDSFKITIAFNPSQKQQRNLLPLIESVSGYLNDLKMKTSWYFLPFINAEGPESLYRDFFICSLEKDRGASYKSLMNAPKLIESSQQVFDYLNSKKVKNDHLKTCLGSLEIRKKTKLLDELILSQKLVLMPQIIYDNEVEYQIPGLLELKDRVELKLKTKNVFKK